MATTNSGYTLLGSLTVVPTADVASATSPINKAKGDTRKGGDASGKAKGMEILRDNGDGTYTQLIALGSAATDKWQVVDGSAQVTPA